MVRIVFTLIAAAVFTTACTTMPDDDQAASATAGNIPENLNDAGEQRDADLRALDELTGILLAATDSYEAAAADEAAASLVRAGEAPSLYETLASARQSLAGEVQERVAGLEGEVRETASAEGEDFYAVVNIADALDEGPELVLAEALSGESYLVDTLRAYLADPSISVETKTFFQEVLPSLRAERDALALLVDTLPEGALPEEDSQEADPQDNSEEGVSPENEEENDGSDAEEAEEEPDNNAAAAEAMIIAAQS